MKEFKVGSTVICVKDHPSDYGDRNIKKNEILVIRSKFNNTANGKLLLRFEGIVGSVNPNTGNERGYEYDYFLPLDDFKEVTFTELKKEMPVSAQ